MPAASSLKDNFNENAITANWNTANSADGTKVSVVGGILHIGHAATSEYNALWTGTPGAYDLTSSNFFCEIINLGNQALASHEVILAIYIDTNNELWFSINVNTISAYKRVASVQTQVGSSIPYSINTHKWIRFREVAGTIYWDTSPDSSNWTNQWTLANPFSITAITMQMQCGCYANEASASFGEFDNFNFPRMVRLNNSGLRPRAFAPGMAR